MLPHVVQLIKLIRCHIYKSAYLVMQHQLHDDAGSDHHQGIVGADLNPVVATRGCIQVMAAPVVDHIILVTVRRRKSVPPVKPMFWAHAASVTPIQVVWASLLFRAMRRAGLVTATVLRDIDHQGFIALRECDPTQTHRQGQDGANNCFTVHAGLPWVEK